MRRNKPPYPRNPPSASSKQYTKRAAANPGDLAVGARRRSSDRPTRYYTTITPTMKHTLVAAIPRMVAGRNLAVGSHMAGILNSIAGAFRPQQIKRARGRSSENPGWASQVEQDRGNDKLDDWQQQRQFQLAQSWAPDSSDLGRRLRPKQRSRLPPGISARKGECHHRCKCIPVRTVPETREQSAPGKQEGQHAKIGQREKGPGEPADKA